MAVVKKGVQSAEAKDLRKPGHIDAQNTSNAVKAQALPTRKARIAKAAGKSLPEISANPLKLPWPRDKSGVLQPLREAGIAAVEGIQGNDEKLAAFLANIGILAKYARARHTAQKQLRNRRRDIAIATAHKKVEAELVNLEHSAVQAEKLAKFARAKAEAAKPRQVVEFVEDEKSNPAAGLPGSIDSPQGTRD